MGIIEFKGGARWQPAIGVSPDLAGLRPNWRPGAKRDTDIVTRAVDAIADLSPLMISVALLAVLLSTIYLFADAAIPINLLPGNPFTVSDFIIPLAFFLIQLTCRRHGPARALTQMLAALALCVIAFVADPPMLRDLIQTVPALTLLTASAFAIAFALANCAGIVIFEATRGPQWWRAPAFGGVVTALIFCGIFYPLAELDQHGAGSAALHFAQQVAEIAMLLIPYWLLRSTIKPMPGLNGY